MTTVSNVESTIIVSISHTELVRWLQDEKAIPADWNVVAVDTLSKGTSQGFTATVKNPQKGHTLPAGWQSR